MSAEQVDPRDLVDALPAEFRPAPDELGPPRRPLDAPRYVARHSRVGQPERVAPALLGFAVCMLLAVVAGVAFVALI